MDAEFGPAGLEALARSLQRLAEESGKAWASRADGASGPVLTDEMPANLVAAATAFFGLADELLRQPDRAAALQSDFLRRYGDLWQRLRTSVEGNPPPDEDPLRPTGRFSDPEWQASPYFDFLRRSHLLAEDWTRTVLDASSLDAPTRRRAAFYLRELLNAASPANFPATNPVVLREATESAGETLMRGMQQLAEDLNRFGEHFSPRHAEPGDFRVGIDLAATPGKVVFRNALIELLQYEPATPTVRRRPLLIVPPWINKFYILDLAPQKSFIEWAVGEGLTVFCISWVNPDAAMADTSFEDYVRLGIDAAVQAICDMTRHDEVDALGYCIGGTLLAAAAADARRRGDERLASLTLLAAQLDFAEPGELSLFIDETQLAYIERYMKVTGFMDGRDMARVFNHLRSETLVWPYVVDAYLRGRRAPRFDLLYWNSDTTRVPAANHAFYLRRCYLENALAAGTMPIGGETVDLQALTLPVYAVAAEEDHIAPAASVLTGLKLLPGPVTFVLAGSGHIAGIVNPPARGRYAFRAADLLGPHGLAEWTDATEQKPGSWWPHWRGWLERLDASTVKARKPGGKKHPPLGDAPGTYVMVR